MRRKMEGYIINREEGKTGRVGDREWEEEKKENNQRNRNRRRRENKEHYTISSFMLIVCTYLSASLCVRWTLALTLHSRQIPVKLNNWR
jgi:hypothetical protein